MDDSPEWRKVLNSRVACGKPLSSGLEFATHLTIPMFFEEKDKNLRKALCNAFEKAQNWSIENGNTGSGIE